MNNSVKNILIIILFLCLTSCSAEIEPASANSISAVLAVACEYLLAIISLIALFLIHCVRVASIAIIVAILFGNLRIEQLNSGWLLLIVLLLFVSSFITPIKFHDPKVVIAKNIAKIKNNESKDNSQRTLILEIVGGVITGLILIIIEQNIDFDFIK